MVILGGLEVVAAGYLIHKHQKNKRERERIEDERAALEEEQYQLFSPQNQQPNPRHRRHRSDSRRRHSHDRRHSRDRRHRRDSPKPASQSVPPPPRYESTLPTAPIPPPQDIKYGWSNERPTTQPSQQQQDHPPTGWPAHWPQSQRPDPNAGRSADNLPRGQSQRAESSRGRSETRPYEPSPSHVRFAVPRNTPQPGERSQSLSPPPRYKP